MSIHSLGPIVEKHPFFKGLDKDYIEFIAGCAKNVTFKAGQSIFREGEQADWFYLIREGRIVLDLSVPPRGKVSLETLEPGDVLGWAWLFPPYKWHFGATVLEPVRALAMDGKCLRGKCENDPRLGYELMMRFARVMMERLQAARIQLLDVYGHDDA